MKNWIIIGTKLDTKEFNKQLREQKKILEQYSKEAEELTETKIGFERSKEQAQKNLNKATIELEKQKARYQKLEQAGMTNTLPDIADKIKDLEKQISDMQFVINNSNKGLENTNKKLLENAQNAQRVKKEMIETNEQIEKTKAVKDIKKQIDSISNSITGVIKKVGRWVLAIFGIRTAYNMILRSINIISQGNNQLKADIDYMRNILAYTLEPIVEKIVNFLKQMLIYVGYIIYKWTGKNIFANADKSLKNANKSAKALQKTLAGFDEMNIVGNKNNETQPSFNLAQEVDKFSKDEEPAWMSWIITNGPKVAKIIAIIGAAIAGLKFGMFLSQSVRFVKEVLGPIGAFLLKHAGVIIKIGGLLAIIGGIITLVKGLIDYLKDPTWDNFMKILTGIFLIAGGIALVFGGIPGLIALIVGAVVALGVAIYKNWDKIKSWFSNMGEKVEKNIIKPIKDKFKALPNWFKTLIKGLINGIITLINGFIIRLNEKLTPLRAVIGAIGGMFGAKWTLSQVAIPTIKYLANGGIINLPGKGVPLNIGGENGPEGVVPLTNEQQMDLLGKTIAKYLTIDLTNITNLDGRTIARSIKKIQGQNDFVMNR